MMFDFPFLGITQQRYDEYEKGESNYKSTSHSFFSLCFPTHPPKVQEAVSGEELAKERAETIRRLWEPYETETFNLKALIGDATAIDGMVGRENEERGRMD
jgi:hypothetical protein